MRVYESKHHRCHQAAVELGAVLYDLNLLAAADRGHSITWDERLAHLVEHYNSTPQAASRAILRQALERWKPEDEQ